MIRLKYIPPLFFALAFTALCFQAKSQPDFGLSDGVYRIPYADSTEVRISRDHITHDPPGRIDMVGINGTAPYHIVAAANGTIRYIDDSHENAECDSVTGCAPCNNYVWIEHPNGEWTKYTHFIKGTVSGLGWNIGDKICVGDYLGDEGDIGCASGVHLHFEVAVPDNLSNPFDTVGGFINGINLIPIICGIGERFFVDDDEYLALPCDQTICEDELTLTDTVLPPVFVVMANSITSDGASQAQNKSAGLFQAGTVIRLAPNVHLEKGCEFRGRIGPCNKPVWEPVDGCANFTDPNPQFMTISSTPEKAGLVCMPNPVSDLLEIGFIMPREGDYQMWVTDLQGRFVRSVSQASMVKTGFHTLELDVSGFRPGTYLLILQTGEEVATTRFIVMK